MAKKHDRKDLPMGMRWDAARRRYTVEVRSHLKSGRKLRHFSTHEDFEEAKEALRTVRDGFLKLAVEEKNGEDVEAKLSRAISCPSFAEYFSRWIHSRRAARLRPSTVAVYEQHGRVHLVPRFGEARIDTIRRAAVQAFVDDLSVAGHNPGGVRAILAVLSSCLGRAVRDGHLTANPCAGIERPKMRAEDIAAKRRALTREEVAKVLDAASPPKWRVVFLVYLGSGMRRSELARLRWEDVVLDAELPHFLVRRAKSNRPRVAPMLPDAAEALRSWPRSTTGEVFPFLGTGPDGDMAPEGRAALRGALARAVAASGIGGHVRTHDLRHTFATLSALDGVPLTALQAAGGWSSLALVSRYARAEDTVALAAWRDRRASNSPAGTGSMEGA